MRVAVIIMSRVPRPGKTKTRLMPPLSAHECADFHRAALRDTCNLVRQSGLDGFIYYADEQAARGDKYKFCLSDSLWSLGDENACYLGMRPQRGKDLGERMKNAAGELLLDYDAVVLVGCDSPTLSIRHINQIPTQLVSHDLVLGPADDGGYYLLALKKAYNHLFSEIPWGTSGVLTATLARASSLNLSYALLEPLADIDTWQDLLHFVKNGELSDKTYAQLVAFQYAQYLLAKYAGQTMEA